MVLVDDLNSSDQPSPYVCLSRIIHWILTFAGIVRIFERGNRFPGLGIGILYYFYKIFRYSSNADLS